MVGDSAVRILVYAGAGRALEALYRRRRGANSRRGADSRGAIETCWLYRGRWHVIWQRLIAFTARSSDAAPAAMAKLTIKRAAN